jgi:hypothetical protein
MRKTDARAVARRALRIAAAAVLLVMGLVFVIPGVPGPGLLVLAGAALLLMSESRRLRRGYVRLKRRYPRLFRPIEDRRDRRRRARAPEGERRPGLRGA